MKYIKLEIVRSQSTELYLEVPAAFDAQWKFFPLSLLKAAVEETVQNYEWEDDDAGESLECIGFQVVPGEEAVNFKVYRLP